MLNLILKSFASLHGMRYSSKDPSKFQCRSLAPVVSAVGLNLAVASRPLQVRFSSHKYKPISREVFHPAIPGPENLPPPPCFHANLDPMQTFIPYGYRWQTQLEALRAGDYLGKDAPFGLLRKWQDWRSRKYNCVQENIPWTISSVKGVFFSPKLNCWCVQWHEDSVHRTRRFRAAYGYIKSKLAAEKFRKDLEAAGRVDNLRTERQMRLHNTIKKTERQIRKKQFSKLSSGQF